MSNTGGHCPDESALEQFAMGRLEGAARSGVADHADSCEECAAAVEALKAEHASIEAALRAGRRAADEGCLSDERLALYLDKALDDGGREAVEEHLALCALCRERLVALYRDVAAMREGRDPIEPGEVLSDDAPAEAAKLLLHAPVERTAGGLGALTAPVAWSAALTAAAGISSFIAGAIGPERILFGAAVWSLLLGHIWSSRRMARSAPKWAPKIRRRRAPSIWLCSSMAAVIAAGVFPDFTVLCVAASIFGATIGFLGHFTLGISIPGTQSENWGYNAEEREPAGDSEKTDERDEASG